MAKQFYRKVGVCAMVGCSLLSVAQTKPRPRNGPRALSVLEKDSKGNMRLVPVTIWIQDRYYDAAQYQANPVPMVAEPGNVYQVLNANVPIGWFTTEQPKQVRGNWISAGTWQEKQGEAHEQPGKVEVNLGNDSDRPVLKRHGQSSASSGGQAGSDSRPSSNDDDPDRPTLRKSKTADDSSSGSSSSTPTIAKRSAAPVDEDLSKDTNVNDPDRPVLRKTKAGANPTDEDKGLSIPTGVTQAAAPPKIAPQAGAEPLTQYIAISDAEKTEYRPYTYELTAENKPRFAAMMQKIAAPLLQKWALAHGNVKLPATVTFTDFDLRAYDVDYSNNPELVFTASYSPSEAPAPAKKRPGVKAEPGPAPTKPVTYYLTLVARIDSSGEANPLFSQITDSSRLDAYSRLELVDAVDADGYGRGSLLFREYNDVGKAFVLYRVDAYNLTKLFEGGSGE